MSDPKSTIKRKFVGEVVSTSMNKTIAVMVSSVKEHPVYAKKMKRSQKFLVHDENNAMHVGDIVEFVECRPLSRHKRWRVLRQVK